MELQAQSQVNVWTQINEKTMETALRGHVTAHLITGIGSRVTCHVALLRSADGECVQTCTAGGGVELLQY